MHNNISSQNDYSWAFWVVKHHGHSSVNNNKHIPRQGKTLLLDQTHAGNNST